MIDHLSGSPLAMQQSECLRDQGGRHIGSSLLKRGELDTDAFVKFSANTGKPPSGGLTKAFKLGLLGMMMISPGCTGGAKAPEKPASPVTTQPMPSELPPIGGKDPVQKPVTPEPPQQVSQSEKPQPVQDKSQTLSMHERVAAELLQSNDVSGLMVGLGQLSAMTDMADTDKIRYLTQFLEKKIESPKSNPSPHGMMSEMAPQMTMMGNPQMHLSKVFYPAVASIRNDAVKAAFIREKVLPSQQGTFLQYHLETVLASFTKASYQEKDFQNALNAFARTLIHREGATDRSLGAYLLSFSSGDPNVKHAPLLLANPSVRESLLKKLLDDPDAGVRGMTLHHLGKILKDPHYKDVDRINWFNASLLIAEQMKDVPDPQANLVKQSLAPFLLDQIATLENDDLKEKQLRTFAERNGFYISTAGADALVNVLKTFSPWHAEQQTRLMTDLLGSSRIETSKLMSLALLQFPDHPSFADNLVRLCRSWNTDVVKLAIPHVAELDNPVQRKSLVSELMDYRKEELVGYIQQMNAGHERHRQMDEALEKIEDGTTQLSQEEQKALLAELDRVTRDLPELGEKAREISGVIEKVAGLIGHLKSDPALQEHIVRTLMAHPHTQVHLFAVRQIPHLPTDALKAEMIRQGTSVERYTKFYRATDDLDVKDDSNLPFHENEGQTPFESIAVSATLAVKSVSDDAVKVPLMVELGKHPVRTVRLDASTAIPSLKSGHEAFKASILEWAKDPKPLVVRFLKDSLKDYPKDLLVDTLQSLVAAQDTPDSEGWRSRATASVLMPLVPDAYDAQKAELMMKLAAESNPIVRSLVLPLGIPIKDPAARERLIQFYFDTQIPEFKTIGLMALPADSKTPEEWKGLAIAQGDPGVRAVAVRNAAQQLSPEARLAWLDASVVNADEAQVRVEVVKVLAALPESQGRDALLQALAADKEPMVRIQVARELSAMKSVSGALSSTLEALCQDPHPAVRLGLTPAVRKISDHAFQKKLTDALLKTDIPEMRAKLAWFLMSTVEDPLSL